MKANRLTVSVYAAMAVLTGQNVSAGNGARELITALGERRTLSAGITCARCGDPRRHLRLPGCHYHPDNRCGVHADSPYSGPQVGHCHRRMALCRGPARRRVDEPVSWNTTKKERRNRMNPVELLNALGHDNPTPTYTPVDDNRIPVRDWDRDHWSTLAYLETRIVDHCGRIDHDHMRCHADRHPFMLRAKRRSNLFGSGDGSAYPTRLRNGRVTEHHDDYDCIDDMIAAGLVTVVMPAVSPGTLVTGLVEAELMARATYALTDLGQRIAGRLRAHKGNGGNYAGFDVAGVA